MRLEKIENIAVVHNEKIHDFIYESNKGKDVFFVGTEEEAVARLMGK